MDHNDHTNGENINTIPILNTNPVLNPSLITKYVDKLPIPKLLKPKKCNDKDQYNIYMKQGEHRLHKDLKKTKLWSFNGEAEPLMIEAERFKEVKVNWINDLPKKHLLSEYIDYTIMGVTGNPEVRTSIHLHGGDQAAKYDGGPEQWFVPGQYVSYKYPNIQYPTTLFWHDHAMGITRLNNYAGLAGGIYLIRDHQIEDKLNLPSGKYEIPLVITDKMLDIYGQLVYSTVPSNPEVHPKWASHFLGNIILVNNKIWPYLKVKRGKYRFRIVNASDTRTYTLSLTSTNSTFIPDIIQIGTDGGYLPKPLVVNQLTLAVAERADIIIDFSKVAPGTEFILTNTANAPFPNGNAPDPNNVGQIMKIIVKSKKQKQCFDIKVPKIFYNLDPAKVTKVRQILLHTAFTGQQTKPIALYLNNESYENPITELPKVGSTEIWEFINLTNGMHPIHLHLVDFQLLNRQNFDFKKYTQDLLAQNPNIQPGKGIKNPLDVTSYLQGNAVSPYGTNENAWKDVIQAQGNMVTRIIVNFSPQGNLKYPFNPKKGEYTWHCHILSHEDNEMMRPFKLT